LYQITSVLPTPESDINSLRVVGNKRLNNLSIFY